MTKEKIPVIAIIGRPPSAKTEFSLSLAKELNAEVISVDSRQVYRYLDVGRTRSRARCAEKSSITLLDIADRRTKFIPPPDFAQDAGRLRRGASSLAGACLCSSAARHFITAPLSGALSEDCRRTTLVRAQLSAEIEERGLAALHDELLEIDPEAGARIHPNDPVRTMRALEIFRITGRNASWWYKDQQKMESPYDIFYIALTRLRANLYQNLSSAA